MAYPIMAEARPNRAVDLRSDTVTRPSPGMLKAMAEAELGDDVYGEDPTIIALEGRVADLFGKEAGLFFSSGTQSNLAALLAHCARGEEYIVGDCYHTFKYEAGGASVLGGIAAFPLATDARGGLDPNQVDGAVKADDSHFPVTRLLSMENTVSGFVQSMDRMNALAAAARRHGLSVHLDGARVWNAATALSLPPAEIAGPADTVSACLSKGLGAPAGTVLSGPKDLIARARRIRKMLGGGMRQAGVLAACGLYALDHLFPKLAEDHEKATIFADKLADIEGLSVRRSDTNMVFLDFPNQNGVELADHLGEAGITIAPSPRSTRIVFHHDVSHADAVRTADQIAAFVAAKS